VPLAFDIRLVERLPDRVVLAVRLAPHGGPVSIEGVAVELFNRARESLSPRLLLPIAGALQGELSVQVELRAKAAITTGAVIVGTAWSDKGQACAYCPADPSTELESHVRGRRCVGCECERANELEWLTGDERDRLIAAFPWIAPPTSPCLKTRVDEPVDVTDEVEMICHELGIDAENAAFLRSLLEDDA
jgi:hypothetical protein